MLLGLFLVKSCALTEAVVRKCSTTKRVLNNFTGKHLSQSFFFDKAAGWRPDPLLKKELNTGLFLCIFRGTFWCELADILFLLVDIFWCCCCWWYCHIKLLIKSLLTPLGRRRAVFALSAAIFQNVCLRFT